MSDPIYCALAFNSVSFGPFGGSRPCCAVDTQFWQESKDVLPDYDDQLIPWFNNSSLVKLRKTLLEGSWSPVCNMCKTRESHGQPSTRTIFNEELDRIEKSTRKNWKEDKSVLMNLSKIFLLDVTVGNKCNSACLMCNPAASSLWAKEQEIITGKEFTWMSKNWFAEEHVPALIDHLPNLRTIQFVGGEPTISQAHIFLLKKLIELDRAKDISLGYVTNLTGVSDELLELWGHFGTKNITISVDGIGPVNEYIRYPFSWNKVVSQLSNLKNIAKHGGYNIGLSHTVTSLNMLTIDELLGWWEEEIKSSPSISSWLPHIQCVNNPDHFNPIYMPREMKEKARESLLRVEQMAIRNNLGSKYTAVVNNIRTNILDKDAPEGPVYTRTMWLKMQDFLISLDKYRNRDIFEYLPFMKEYWIDTQYVEPTEN